MPKLRQNPITGEWIVIAPERAKRPDDFIRPKPIPKTKVEFCNFCKGGEAYNERIEGAGTKHVYVVDNKYPAFTLQPEFATETERMYYSQRSVGAHEVITLIDHNRDLEELPVSYLDELFEVYQKRIILHSKNPDIEYVMPIHNHGPEAAETIDHPHSQLFASCVIPNLVARELEGAKKFYQEDEKCIFCEIIKTERKIKQRIVLENEDFVCFAAYAARAPFEMWILPKKHQDRLEEIQSKTRKNLAEIFQKAARKLYNGLNDPSYNFYFHSAPCREIKHKDYYHFHLEIFPRLTHLGGYELGSGIYIEVVSPERAAEFLRQVKI